MSTLQGSQTDASLATIGDSSSQSASLNVRQQVYHAKIHKCAVELTLPFGARRKIGFPAIIKQAGAGRKDGIERQARLLQGYRCKKSDIEVSIPSGAKVRRRDIQGFDGIKCAKRTPRIP